MSRNKLVYSFDFGFGINTLGDRKKIFFYTGGETANVRKKIRLR